LKRGENDFGEEFKFIDLRFVDRGYEINPKFGQEIPDLATIMKAFPNIRIKLMAYTDNVGEEKANEQLSANRAMAIKSGLETAGISGERIEISAFGEKYPVADNSTTDGRMLNNRIEMMILSK
jgi:outer membrane protein OmpA-like peptidoglycan-associated protein